MIKVGDFIVVKHRINPVSEIKEEKGTVLSIGVTSDGVKYFETNVGSHTKKFVM